MTKTLAITEVFTTLNEVESNFNLRRTSDIQFFPEWYEGLPELTISEKENLDRVKNIHFYHRSDGPLLEGTINLLVGSPLLYLAGFCEPPFKIKAEKSVEIELDDGKEIVTGRLDVLVLQNQFWLLVAEAKRTTFPCLDAIPQALAYMMANPLQEYPTFGLVTNGDYFIFLKLVKQPAVEYAWSADFSMFSPPNKLYDVLQVMKRIGGAIAIPD